jgi:DNA (cytosine-5)-methyltransferase 1
VGYSEIDKYAVEIYQKRFPEHKNYGDITKIKPSKLPDFDLLVGGFPCQAFSIAGKRKGFKDTRGTLFFDIARILRSKKPRLFVLENVKGLLSHDSGNTFKTIISTLAKLGYDIQWQVLNSKNFGVPQNRERVFIIGHLRGTARPKVFPFTENNSEDIVLPTITTRVTADSNGTYVGKRSPRQIIGSRSQGDRVYDPSGISVTLASQAGGLGAKTGLYAVKIKEATKKGYAEARPGQAINLAVPNSKTRRGRVSDVAQTLDTSMQQHTLTPDMKIRRLTPRECERLQGFPDGWTDGVSDSQKYKTLGNAVTVNVVEVIIRKIISSL